MQIRNFGYPDGVMDAPLITRCLEEYILWLFGKWMFTKTHVDTISARYISLAREIADA